MRRTLVALALLLLATPLAAKDSLGVFGSWGAFHDPDVPRCYAIAAANESRNAREFEAPSGLESDRFNVDLDRHQVVVGVGYRF